MPEDAVNRYAGGELPPAEARELARQSLEDPELFEELTTIALARAAVAPHAEGSSSRWRRHAGWWTAIAAGITLVTIGTMRVGKSPAYEVLPPALADAAKPGQPALLASGLQPQTAVSFRGEGATSRDPRETGRVLAVVDGLVTIDLGGLDGLAKDRELEVVRGNTVAGRLVVIGVFRERAEARAIAGSGVNVNDVVRAPAAGHLQALLDRSAAQYARGEAEAARATAQKAAEFGESANLPQRTEAWNRLGVLLMLARQYDAAIAPLRHAAAIVSKTDPLYRECINNLAVLAEIQHDRSKAADLYSTALAATSNPNAGERRVIESNLYRVRSSQ